MATLLTHRENGRVRHCNSKCYNATHDKCTCICHGVNHGIGFDAARENVERWRRDFDLIALGYETLWDPH